jgi:hypothetical protein
MKFFAGLSRTGVWIGRRTPLVRELVDISAADLREAGKQMFLIWTFTSIPLLLNALVDFFSVRPPSPTNRLIWAISNNLKFAEVFFYANAFLAPVFLVIYKLNRNRRFFRSHMALIVATHLVLVVSLLLFGLLRGGKDLEPQIVAYTSIVLYIMALFIRYVLIVCETFSDFRSTHSAEAVRMNAQFSDYTGTR